MELRPQTAIVSLTADVLQKQADRISLSLDTQVLISLIPVSHTQGGHKAVVSIKPDTHVYRGESVTFRCDIQGGEDTEWTYSWYKNNDGLAVRMGYGFYTGSTKQKYILRFVSDSDSGNYTCQRWINDSQSSLISDVVKLTVSERPALSVSRQNWLTEGDSVTLSCVVTKSSTGWRFSWYTENPYRQIRDSHGDIVYGASYTICPAALNHTGVYWCDAQREGLSLRFSSNKQRLWVTGESPPVSLIINPSRTQHFINDSLSLSCQDQSDSTGRRVNRYTHSDKVSSCSRWGSVTGSTCNISSLSTSHTGVYWCESESGENSNPVNITVQDGDVILESPVHPVTKGHPLTLHCLYRHMKPSNLRADFYKDGSVFQTQSTGEMIMHKVSKSDEGFYHCKHPERGESAKSWVSVRGSGPLFVEGSSGVEAPFSVLMLISSVVTASPYLMVTIILLFKCYRARAAKLTKV